MLLATPLAPSAHPSINYVCTDIEKMDFGRRLYDSVWFNGSLHHIEPLELVLKRMNVSLKDDGFLFLNEYVGPSRFGFPHAQRQALEHAFKLIPPDYRKSFMAWNFGQVSDVTPIPDPEEVRRVDPSEAVRSADILSALALYFDIVVLESMRGYAVAVSSQRDCGEFSRGRSRLDGGPADAVCNRGCLDRHWCAGKRFRCGGGSAEKSVAAWCRDYQGRKNLLGECH